MVRRKSEIIVTTVENLRGGKGIISVEELASKDELYNKGRLFAVTTVKPGDSIGFHKHEGEMEAYYILQGKGLYSDNGVETEVNAGDVTYTPDGEGHSMANIGDEDLKFIALIVFN